MSHIWMSHVTHMNESCHTYEWVMSHIWMSHTTHMNASTSHTYEWVMFHIWMSHVTHMNESCHTWMRQHVTHMNKSCHTHEWNIPDITATNKKHTATPCNTLQHTATHCNTHECVNISRIWMSHATHTDTASNHTYEWVTPHTWMRHNITHMNESCHAHEWNIPDILRMSHATHMNMTHSYVRHESFMCVTSLSL